MTGILRGIVIAASAGVGIGLGAILVSRREPLGETDDGLLRLEPLLDRLDWIQARLDAVENSVTMLREGARLADANLRQLIGAVERLCECAQLAAVHPGSDPPSFQDQLMYAMQLPDLFPEPRT